MRVSKVPFTTIQHCYITIDEALSFLADIAFAEPLPEYRAEADPINEPFAIHSHINAVLSLIIDEVQIECNDANKVQFRRLFQSFFDLLPLLGSSNYEHFNGKVITSRLQGANKSEAYIDYYIGQLWKLQAYIAAKLESLQELVAEPMDDVFSMVNNHKATAKAIEKGYLERTDTGYKWTRSKVLLDYFLGKMFCGDYIDDDGWWQPEIYKKGVIERLQMIFGANVGNSRKQYLCLGRSPRGYKKIDGLFG